VSRPLIDNEAAGFRFRHALVRDAVLASLLAPRLQRLAATTRAAVERAHPGLPGEWCVLAADLAEEAGRPAAAAALLVVAGRRALQQAALASAERLLRRAAGLAAPADGLIACELLAEVLAAAGRVEEAVEVIEVVRAALAGAVPDTPDPQRVARLTLVLARAAVTAERWALAADQLAELRAHSVSGPALLAEATALAAQVAIGRGEIEQALQLARDAVGAAGRDGRPEAACDAWESIGRVERPCRCRPRGRRSNRPQRSPTPTIWCCGGCGPPTARHDRAVHAGPGRHPEHAQLTGAARCSSPRCWTCSRQRLYPCRWRGRNRGQRPRIPRGGCTFRHRTRGTCFAVIGHAPGGTSPLTCAASAPPRCRRGSGVGCLSPRRSWDAPTGRRGLSGRWNDRRNSHRHAGRAPSPWWGCGRCCGLCAAPTREGRPRRSWYRCAQHADAATPRRCCRPRRRPRAAIDEFTAADTTITPTRGATWAADSSRPLPRWGDLVGWLAAGFFDRFRPSPRRCVPRPVAPRRAPAMLAVPPSSLGVTPRKPRCWDCWGSGCPTVTAARLYCRRAPEKHVENPT
jgi:hypothetical protein